MTRVVVDPGELNRLAGFASEAAAAYAAAAHNLVERSRPALPAAVGDAVNAGLDRVANRLGALSANLEAQAFLLQTRAAIVDNDAATKVLLGLGRDLDA